MENNGRGIFYGVIGVATLVVAIMGATFAYFASTAAGGANAANASSVSLTGTLAWDDEDTTIVAQKMIPATKATMLGSYALAGTNKCKGKSAAGGDVLYDICSAYDFTISNSADVDQTIYFSFASVTNTFGYTESQPYKDGNLTFCLYRRNVVSEGQELSTDPNAKCQKVAKAGQSVNNFFSDRITASDNNQYTLVLYVNEIDDDQTKEDSGKAFAGTMSVSTSGGENKVTGTIVGLS